jgi:hypothetical protein
VCTVQFLYQLFFDDWYLSGKGVLRRYRRCQGLSLRPRPLNVIIIIITQVANPAGRQLPPFPH